VEGKEWEEYFEVFSSSLSFLFSYVILVFPVANVDLFRITGLLLKFPSCKGVPANPAAKGPTIPFLACVVTNFISGDSQLNWDLGLVAFL
jgi:hypothetical protein